MPLIMPQIYAMAPDVIMLSSIATNVPCLADDTAPAAVSSFAYSASETIFAFLFCGAISK